jgi:uncharacterized OsmC-like protein
MSASPDITASNVVKSDTNAVNGINVGDVRALVDEVGKNRAKGMTHWKVSSAWQGGMRSRARVESFRIGGTDVPRRFTIDVDEPCELGGGNAFANPQEHLLAALNACMIVGYAALCSLEGITLQKLEIASEGDIDLRGFFGLDESTAPGYESIRYTVTIKGDGTQDQFAKIHELVMATSPNFSNLSRTVRLQPTLVVE